MLGSVIGQRHRRFWVKGGVVLVAAVGTSLVAEIAGRESIPGPEPALFVGDWGAMVALGFLVLASVAWCLLLRPSRHRKGPETRSLIVEAQAMLDTAPVGLLSERDGLVLACNRWLEQTFGYRLGELKGQDYRRLFAHEETVARINQRMADIGLSGNVHLAEVELRRKGGEVFRGSLTVSAVYAMSGGQGARTWVFACDTAESAESELPPWTRMPEKQSAPAASAAKSGEKALEGISAQGFDGVKEVAETLPFDLDDAMAGVAALLSAKAGEKGLELVVDTGPGQFPVLVGDPIRLGQVLTHLIGNAIKFAGRGDILVSVRERQRHGNSIELQFSVRDQGNGLTPEQQAGLFQALTLPDRRDHGQSAAAGFGLAICRRLVESLGGRIWVESQYGQGATFHFTAVFEAAPNPGPVERYAEQLRAFAGRRVMVIDDNRASRLVAGSLLQKLGFVPDLFDSGRAAMALLVGQQAPQYLFCCTDRTMPDLNGFQVARLLRAHYGRACPPVLLLAAGGARDTAQDFAAVVSKPLSLGQMFHHVAMVLGLDNAKANECRIDGGLASGLNGKRVLLVDDAVHNREVIADLLNPAGMRVRPAGNGLEALQAVREEMPDCVLMDCRMPAMDGFEATARLRHLGFTKLPIIGLLDNALPGERETGMAAGMSDFVSKPVTASALQAALSKWLAPPRSPVASPVPEVMRENEGEALPPLPPGLDVATGLRRLRGKTSLFLKALRIFRDSRGHQFQLDFQAAVAAQEWQASERLAHNLKTAAAIIGAHGVCAAAASLEAALRAGSYGEVQPLLADLTEKLRAIVDGLAHIG